MILAAASLPSNLPVDARSAPTPDGTTTSLDAGTAMPDATASPPLPFGTQLLRAVERAASLDVCDASPCVPRADASSNVPGNGFAVPASPIDVVDGKSDTTADDEAGPPVASDASADLAAQLALMAQWAGVVPPVVSSTPSSIVIASRASASTGDGASAGPIGAHDAVVADAMPATTRASMPTASPAIDATQAAAAPASPVHPDDIAAVEVSSADGVQAAPARRPAGPSVSTSALEPRRDAERATPDVSTPTMVARPSAPDRAVDAAMGETKARDRDHDHDHDHDRVAVSSSSSTSPATSTDASSIEVAARIHADAGAAPVTTASSPPLAEAPASLQARVGSPAWSNELGQATLHIALGSIESASLRLHPEALGPLDVRVRIDDGVAHLAFHAEHAETRQAIEASRPMLDALFANQGLAIGDCSVADGSLDRSSTRHADASSTSDTTAQQSQGGDAATRDGRGSRRVVLSPDDDMTLASARAARPLGLVDLFA